MALTWQPIVNGSRAEAGNYIYYTAPTGSGDWQTLYRTPDTLELTHIGYSSDMEKAQALADQHAN